MQQTHNIRLQRAICYAIMLAFGCLHLPQPVAAQQSADVVVYGATPGGFCAAIAAAREGVSVILLEPTDHVGGVNTGGLSFSDSNQTARSTMMGLFDEWHTRIEQDYASRDVQLPYPQLRRRLLAQGQVLALPDVGGASQDD